MIYQEHARRKVTRKFRLTVDNDQFIKKIADMRDISDALALNSLISAIRKSGVTLSLFPSVPANNGACLTK